jgi:hypothetical protein
VCRSPLSSLSWFSPPHRRRHPRHRRRRRSLLYQSRRRYLQYRRLLRRRRRRRRRHHRRLHHRRRPRLHPRPRCGLDRPRDISSTSRSPSAPSPRRRLTRWLTGTRWQPTLVRPAASSRRPTSPPPQRRATPAQRTT